MIENLLWFGGGMLVMFFWSAAISPYIGKFVDWVKSFKKPST